MRGTRAAECISPRSPGVSSRPVLGLSFLLAAGLIVAFFAAVGWTVYMLTHPPRRTYASAVARGRPGTPAELADGGRTFEEWTLGAGGVSLPVWEVAGDDPAAPVWIFSHGWGDSRIGALARMAALAPLASRLIAWDMRGHGDAPGRCSLGLREVDDLLLLIERLGVPVVLFGWSLGAGVSIAAASRAPGRVMGVVAEAPYRLGITPARNVLRAWGYPYRATLPPAMWMIGLDVVMSADALNGGAFDRAQLARQVACPLLVLHGEDDTVSPVEDGREIAAAAPRGRLVVVPGAGHHGLWTEADRSELCTREVLTWVRSALS